MGVLVNIVDLLCCPFHRELDLMLEVDGLKCQACGRLYKKIKSIEGYRGDVYDFLVTEPNEKWSRGLRALSSGFISDLQGGAFDRSLLSLDGNITLDVGCGENARGDVNVDCYIPSMIPANFILANVEHLPLKNKSVDVVSSNYNLEHLVNPAQFIIDAASIARNKISIVTDNSDWIGDVLFRIIGSGRIFHDEHYYKWSSEYLGNLISRLGFSNYEVQCLNLSSSKLVSLASKMGRIPRVGSIFYRDISATIYLNYNNMA